MDKNRRRFKCNVCSKAFKRSEHCARHELMHTQERPYVCRYCYKKYGRKDLVRRHERSIHADQYKELTDRTNTRNSPSDPSGSSDTDIDEQTRRQTNPSLELPIPSGPETLIDGRCDAGQSLPSHPDRTALRRSISPDFPISLSGTNDAFSNSKTFTVRESGIHPFSDMEVHNISAENHIPFSQLLNDAGCEISVDHQNVEEADVTLAHSEQQNQPGDSQAAFFPDHQNQLAAEQSQHSLGNAFDPSSRDCPAVYENNLGSPMAVNMEDGNGFDDNGLDDLNFLIDGGVSSVDVWFKEPMKLTAHLPKILRDHAKKPPKKMVDQACFEKVCRDTSEKIGSGRSLATSISHKELDQFINSFIDAFHPHLPIIHLPSFLPSQAPSLLVLAMASIGALYRLSHRKAHILYDFAERLISFDSIAPSKIASREGVWLIQSRILLTFFAIFSGKSEICTKVFNTMGSFTLDYQWNRLSLQQTLSNPDKGMTWTEWIYCEETKRVLCAIFIVSNLLLIAFDITPGFACEQDLLIEVPSDEMTWAAETADQWEQMRKTRVRNTQTLQNVLETMIQVPSHDKEATETQPISSFTALVVMHATNIYMWHLNQLSQSVGPFSLNSWVHSNLRTALQHTAISALERCQASLLEGRSEDYKIAWDDPESTLIFNCAAMLRSASSRLLLPSMTFNKLSLLSNGQDLITNSILEYTNATLKRTVFMTKASQRAFEGFFVPVTIGHLLVSKTAALHWSVEQAMAGWDSALLLTKWVHTLEMQREHHPPELEELEIIGRLKELLMEMEVEHDEQHSLAAALARAWATFLDDVWVWGITKKMGATLRLLATQYQEQFNAMTANTRPNL